MLSTICYAKYWSFTAYFCLCSGATTLLVLGILLHQRHIILKNAGYELMMAQHFLLLFSAFVLGSIAHFFASFGISHTRMRETLEGEPICGVPANQDGELVLFVRSKKVTVWYYIFG